MHFVVYVQCCLIKIKCVSCCLFTRKACSLLIILTLKLKKFKQPNLQKSKHVTKKDKNALRSLTKSLYLF